MLTENIMHECVVKLLRSNDEESYECLCKLLFTIGKDLDHEKAKVNSFSESFVLYDANWHCSLNLFSVFIASSGSTLPTDGKDH